MRIAVVILGIFAGILVNGALVQVRAVGVLRWMVVRKKNSPARQKVIARRVTTGVVIETNFDNGTWSEAGRFFKSPANLAIPENPNGVPRAVQLRARYVEGDSPVGQFSPTVTIATQP